MNKLLHKQMSVLCSFGGNKNYHLSIKLTWINKERQQMGHRSVVLCNHVSCGWRKKLEICRIHREIA